MSVLLGTLLWLSIWVTLLCAVASVVIIGPRRLRGLYTEALPRIWEIRPQIGILVVVLLVSAVGREHLRTLSELFGLNLTWLIYRIEGNTVPWIQQTFAVQELTLYFSAIYIYGYVFLLVFPLIAYAALPESTTLKRLLTAYSLNYALGLVLYTIVFAHGPRNYATAIEVTSLLYTFDPNLQVLTSEINERSNVFPSLHTSLSVTAAAFAYATRKAYPLWNWIAAWIAVSVVVSTMYLGIHWLLDVAAGVGLAVVCVFISYRYVSPAAGDTSETTTASIDG